MTNSIDDSRDLSLIKNQARWLVCVAAIATLIKLWLAWKTRGSLDIPAYQDHLDKVREFGAYAYHLKGPFGNPLNVPPFALNFVRLAEFLSSSTGLPFAFWFRMPSVTADVASVWLVWKIGSSARLRFDLTSMLLMALCPASIMISGIHGNLDPVMVFFVLLSLFLLTVKRSPTLAALAFGMALNIKVAPLLFAPALFFNFSSWRLRLQFFLIAMTVFFIGSLPYLLQRPAIVASSIFGHAGMYSHWGWTFVLVTVRNQMPFSGESGFHPPGWHGYIAAVAKYVLIVAIVALSFWLNRKKQRPHLFIQFGAVAFLFMFLTPGFGAQYLSWLIPWVIAMGRRSTVIFYATSGVYLAMAYGCVGGLFGCDSFLYLGLVCWASIAFVLGRYRGYLRTTLVSNVAKPERAEPATA